ncbi:MAG: hypothetical protein WBK77_00180 [Alphaproteobacteria bacterium]
MFSKKEILSNLLGCFEIMIFMPRGVERFSSRREDAIKSFIWPAIFSPVALFAFSFHSTGFSLPLLMLLHGGRMLLETFLFLGVVYLFCRHCNRQENFYQVVTAGNWLEIPFFILVLPIVVSLVFSGSGLELGDGWTTSHYQIVGFFATYSVFITLAGYVYTAFILTHILRLPWELCGAVAIFGLGIDETLMDATVMLRDYLAAA